MTKEHFCQHCKDIDVEKLQARERLLVEALEEINHMGEEELLSEELDEVVKQALSAIPDVEGYRLEREVKEAVRHWALAYDDPNPDSKMLTGMHLYHCHRTLEAHREKVKNDA